MLNQKRGKNVAAAGAAFQAVLTVALLAIWLWTGSLSAMSCTLLLAGGVPVWLMVLLLFYCRMLQRREQQELEELQAGRPGSVFEGDQAEQVRPAAARLAWIERWVRPMFTLLWAGFHLAIGVLVLRYLAGRQAFEPVNALEGLFFLVLLCLSGFLLGRYAVGMSGSADLRLLRAAASYLLANVLFIAAAAVSLVVAHYGYAAVDVVVAYAVPVVQIVLAAELAANFILDLYRPRVPGREERPSFDSRLLNLLAEPGKVGHSIAETLNYQFGFEVSRTWFYRLLQRSMVPLILAGAAALMGMSCIVVVNEGEVYVIRRWGKVGYERGTLGPGVHLKYPYPIETAQRFRTGAVHEIMLGAGAELSERERQAAMIKGRELFLWTQEHGRWKERDFLVAIPPETRVEAREEEGKVPAVSIIKLVVALDYVITDPYAYGYQFVDADKLLECVAYREMVRYCASATLTERIEGEADVVKRWGKVGGQIGPGLDLKWPFPMSEQIEASAPAAAGSGGRPVETAQQIEGGSADRPEAIMTYGREAAGQRLKHRIQDRADELGLGVKILRAGLVAAHPPAAVAPEYEKVLQAERGREEKRYLAEAEANQTLSRVAGSPVRALRLAHLVTRLGQLQDLQALKPGTVEFSKKLDEYIARTADNVMTLAEEIRRERLLLGSAEGSVAQESKQGLLAAYEAHLAALKQVAKSPSTFPFAERAAQAAREAETALRGAAGEAFRIAAEANADRWRTELEERARAEAFAQQNRAYEANKRAYETDLRQEVWAEALPWIRKYVLGVDSRRVEIRLHLEQQPSPLSGLRAEQERSTGQ